MSVRAAVLDLGSNSFHVLVADVAGGRVVPVLRQREMLYLGGVVARHGSIPDADAARAVATASGLVDLARRAGATEVSAVATSALRDATNGAEVLGRLDAAIGEPVRVLDGREEGRLAYLGVRASAAVEQEPVLVLDLGGGSLEFAVGHGGEVAWAESVPLGGTRLAAGLGTDPPDKADRKRLRAIIRDAVDPLADRIGDLDPRAVLAVGGAVRALARVVAAADDGWLPGEKMTNQVTLTLDRLRATCDALFSLDLDGRLGVAGVPEARADHLHVAAFVVVEVIDRLGFTGLTVSDWGLREGLLLDAAGGSVIREAPRLRTDEIERLAISFEGDEPHARHVAHLAGLLFDALVDVHNLGDDDRELLLHAARVHTIGEALALRRSHRHGAYLLEHAELRGFSPAELASLVSLVRFRGAKGLDGAFPPTAGLSDDRRARVEHLLVLFQLADTLDRARDQAVVDLHAQFDDDTVTLQVVGDPHVDTADLDRRLALFKRVTGRDLWLVDAGTGASLH